MDWFLTKLKNAIIFSILNESKLNMHLNISDLKLQHKATQNNL